MKKIFLVIFVMVCFSSHIDAQIRYGVKFGLNFDDLKLEKESASASTVKQSTGWQAGAQLQIMVPVLGFGFEPEVLYTAKKVEMGTKKNGLGYFEVPINLRYEFNLILLRPYVLAGPYFGYVVNMGKDLESHFEKSDWGIGVGGGLEIWKLQFGLRYSWGMKDVTKKSIIFGDSPMKNRTCTVSIGYLF